MTERRCHSCGEFYDKKLGPCPACATPAHQPSSHMYTSKLNRHLYATAEHAQANA